MFRLWMSMLATLGICWGCSKQPQPSKPAPPTPSGFALEFIQTLKHAAPGITVTQAAELGLKLTSKEGYELQVFLDNAFSACKLDPSSKTEVIQKYVASTLESLKPPKDEIDRTRIVPIIKDRAWLAEVRQGLKERGSGEMEENIVEEFCGDLVIVYAEDTDQNIRYLSSESLEKAGIEKRSLRVLACDNLNRLLPSVERRGANGTYMLAAGGNYEASLLLIDSIWSGNQFDVRGDPVVSVPARDMLLITGSEDEDGLKKIRKLAADTISAGQYILIPDLFVFKNGKFQPFKAAAQ